MAEVATGRSAANDTDARLSSVAEYLRFGWFARPEMDVYVEAGHRTFLDADGLTKLRVGLGLNWQLLDWLELAPQLLTETRTDLPTRFLAMAQLHLTY